MGRNATGSNGDNGSPTGNSSALMFIPRSESMFLLAMANIDLSYKVLLLASSNVAWACFKSCATCCASCGLDRVSAEFQAAAAARRADDRHEFAAIDVERDIGQRTGAVGERHRDTPERQGRLRHSNSRPGLGRPRQPSIIGPSRSARWTTSARFRACEVFVQGRRSGRSAPSTPTKVRPTRRHVSASLGEET